MHYNLTIKKQRRKFWTDCEKAIDGVEGYDPDVHSWHENGKHLTPAEVYTFWDKDGVLWDETTDNSDYLSRNAEDTFKYYELHDVEGFDDV